MDGIPEPVTEHIYGYSRDSQLFEESGTCTVKVHCLILIVRLRIVFRTGLVV